MLRKNKKSSTIIFYLKNYLPYNYYRYACNNSMSPPFLYYNQNMTETKTKVLRLDDLIDACFDVYQEIGRQVGIPRTILLRKLISNLECINELITKQFTHETLIILRSSIETLVLFCYLTTHLDKQQEYISDSELIEFKNTFILIKNWKKDIDTGNPLNLNLQDAINYHEQIFKERLSEYNKNYILKQLKFKEYKVTLDNLNIIDKFFRTNKRIGKPFFMDMEKMYSELPKLPEIGAEFRDLVYSDYNVNSQVAHGQYYIWTRGIQIDERFIEQVKLQIAKVVTYPLMYLNGQVTINMSNLERLKHITDKLLPNLYKYQ